MVTYHPDEASLRATFRAAAEELDRLIVVDNSTDPVAQSVVDRVASEEHGSRNGRAPTLLERRGNSGLSRALNRGLQRGLEEAQQLFLILDQDSVLVAGAARTLRDAYLQLTPRFPAVELAARNVEEVPSRFQGLLEQVFYRYEGGANGAPRRCPLAMASGLLLDARVLRRTGLFDESLFLDAADHEFCLRSGQNGVPLYLVPTATIRHSLGRPRRSSAGPVSFELREADERRLYYSTRDTLRVVRRYWRIRPFVCGTLLGFIGSRAVVYALFSGRNPGWFRAICRGWAESLRTEDRASIPQAV